VAIGDGTFVNAGCFIDNLAEVRIGSNCALGMQVLVLTSTHPLGGPDRRALNPGTGLPVVIGDGCWVGARAVIMPGVTIAPGCVIGAGAVVTEDTEPDKVYAGVPARVVRELS
jgi:maltose O-acetyltransferase